MEPGRIYSDSGTGFDTDERLFTPAALTPIVGQYTTASRNFPGFSNLVVDTTIASVSSAATVVQGSVKLTVSGTNKGITNKGWYDAGGTILVAMAPVWSVLGSGPSTVDIGSFVMFTFFCDGGSLKLREHYRISPPQTFSVVTAITVNPHVIDYWLIPGTFV